jgi:predicted ATPase
VGGLAWASVRECHLSCADSLLGMRRVLVTGMSGTGKSTALVELAKRGFQVVETDGAPWSDWSEADGGYVWREDLVGNFCLATTEQRSMSLAPSRIRVASTRASTRWFS